MLNKSIFFSIIIPAYNAGKTLAACLESILDQTFSNYEVLVIDGFSTDDTVSIASSYNDSRIKIVSEKDNGIYDAMNKGIRMAKGEWLYFLGADDKFYNNHVLGAVSEKTVGNDVVYGNVYSTRFNGLYDGEFTIDKIYEKNICHQSIFFSKKVFGITGDFILAYKAMADWAHNIQWFLDDHIKKQFIDLIIADYADDGFSANNLDHRFFDEKDKLFLESGKSRLNRKLKMHLYGQMFWQYRNKKQYAISLRYKTLYLAAKYLHIS